MQDIIKNKVWDTDCSIFSLFDKEQDRIHPAELAHVLDVLPFNVALISFTRLSCDMQVKVFPYLNVLLQHRLIRNLSQQRASYLLNNLSSDKSLHLFIIQVLIKNGIAGVTSFVGYSGFRRHHRLKHPANNFYLIRPLYSFCRRTKK